MIILTGDAEEEEGAPPEAITSSIHLEGQSIQAQNVIIYYSGRPLWLISK